MTEKKFNSKIPSASASTVNNTNNNNNAAAAKAEREERLRSALKAFVLKERQRKKEGECLERILSSLFNLISQCRV